MSYSVGDYGRFTQIQEVTVNAKTDDYTLALADAALPTVVEMNKASGVTLTVPTNTAVAFDVGTVIGVYQEGAGQVTIAAAGGVTINSSGGKLKLTGQYSAATLRKQSANVWALVGDIAT